MSAASTPRSSSEPRMETATAAPDRAPWSAPRWRCHPVSRTEFNIFSDPEGPLSTS